VRGDQGFFRAPDRLAAFEVFSHRVVVLGEILEVEVRAAMHPRSVKAFKPLAMFRAKAFGKLRRHLNGVTRFPAALRYLVLELMRRRSHEHALEPEYVSVFPAPQGALTTWML
jgi:hypothetical protein